ncbi:MAG: hypothetical protein RL885_27895 [Planctomycetota bacterium]
MSKFLKSALALAALTLAFGPIVQAAGRTPGSVLIYPVYESSPGSGTVISITNTNNDPSYNGNTNLNGVVDVHFIYIDGDSWTEFNRFERLTPNDTFTVLADTHNPNSENGFLYCIAIDPSTNAPVSHNYLIGDEIVADGSGNWLFGLDALAFKSNAAEGAASDLDADDLMDLDGVEFEAIADEMYISSFIGQDPTYVTSTLYLVSLVGSSDFETRLDFAVYNNNEQEFSTTYALRCWAAVELTDIDSQFTNAFLVTTTYDTADGGLLIGTTGWARIDGDRAVDIVGNEPQVLDPPFVGAMAQSLDGFASGHLLHESDAANAVGGVLDSLQ